MRLTLRTLLAYLDNTLSPQDAETLRNKLTESGFATALVARIRQTISQSDLGATSPTAVDPVGDPNVVGEYLDSTMPAEQIAEVERATLESDVRLAEAAACHQILTMVLGQPAVVPEALRQRIHSMGASIRTQPSQASTVDSATDVASSIGSSISPNSSDSPGLSDEENDSMDDLPPMLPESDSAMSVVPVGRLDSGVFDAPSRISGVETNQSASSIVQQRRKDFDTSDGSMRMARLVPYLAGLATLGILVFALAKVFYPLLDGRHANSGQTASTSPRSDREDLPLNKLVDASSSAEPSNSNLDDSATLADGVVGNLAGNDPATMPLDDVEMTVPIQKEDTGAMTSSPERSISPESPLTESIQGQLANGKSMDSAKLTLDTIQSIAPKSDVDSDVMTEMEMTTEIDKPGNAPESMIASPDASRTDDMAIDPAAMNTTPNDTAAFGTAVVNEVVTDDSPGSLSGAEEMADGDDDAEEKFLVTMLPSDSPTLLIGRLAPINQAMADEAKVQSNGQTGWNRITPEDGIDSNRRLVVPPKFRVDLQISPEIVASVIGPTELSIRQVDQTPLISIDYGRMMVRSEALDAELILTVAGQEVICDFDQADSAIAVSAIHRRRNGVPLASADREMQVSWLVTSGAVDWKVEPIQGGAATEGAAMETQGWTQRTDISAGVAGTDGDSKDSSDRLMGPWQYTNGPIEPIQTQPPSWTSDEGPSVSGNVDKLARDGLLALLNDEKPVEISLREATTFRRSEVAALAGQTLLALGRAEVYFGVDGLLAHEDQKTYWNDHYQMFVSMLDQGPAIAESILDDVRQMDSAGEPTIKRLLRGFSQSDLKAGGDAELVEALNSPSMPIRVLAIENLQAITGKKLFYRAEHETEAKRESAIKTWQGWLRRGDIRWPQDDA